MNHRLKFTGLFPAVRATVVALRAQGIPFVMPRSNITNEVWSSRFIERSWMEARWIDTRTACFEAFFRERDIDIIRLIASCKIEVVA
jgi:hypothetical protein